MAPRTALSAWYVYVLRCSDGSLYTGIARDVAARLRAHESGKGARYTRGRGPLQLLGYARCESHGAALRIELALKALARERKLEIARSTRRLTAFARAVTRAVAARAQADATSKKARARASAKSKQARAKSKQARAKSKQARAKSKKKRARVSAKTKRPTARS